MKLNQVVSEWETEADFEIMMTICEKMQNHLTACVCSNEPHFVNKVQIL